MDEGRLAISAAIAICSAFLANSPGQRVFCTRARQLFHWGLAGQRTADGQRIMLCTGELSV